MKTATAPLERFHFQEYAYSDTTLASTAVTLGCNQSFAVSCVEIYKILKKYMENTCIFLDK